ncbi:pimeloyl-ACP methyl ester carboxylesterase [Paraburkholderia youngii]
MDALKIQRVILGGFDWGARTANIDTQRTIGGGIGHNLPQEAPQAFADAIIEVARY